MRLVIFLVSLCCLLLKGDVCLHASTLRNDINYAHTKEVPPHHKHTPKKQSANSNNTSRDYSAIEDATLETENVINDDLEEDDLMKCYDAKYKLQHNRHSIFVYVNYPSYQSFLNYHGKYFNASPYFFSQVSYKYILQGVLRI